MIFLVFILFVNCFLFFTYHSNILIYFFNLNPKNSFSTFIVFTLVGLHALFALLTMFSSFKGVKFIYRYYLLGVSLLAPTIFLFINFRTVISYQTDSYFFLPVIIICFNLLLNDRKKEENIIRIYIRTLINPLGSMPH